tara:strand:+ start:2917 stop:4980 length:2064 start_codon:yes stop_codon:yes gene_type:complete
VKQYSLDSIDFDVPSDLSQQLNEQQREVAFAPDGQLLVIAGAGSGKTRTLTHRVAHLVEKGVPPDHILLCTFTNKAAREMVERVERLLRRSTGNLWAGTFHHVGNRILRKHAELLDFSPNFTILDREDSGQLIDDAVRESGVLQGNMRFPKGRALNGVFGLTRSTGRDMHDIIIDHFPKFEPVAVEITEVWSYYQKRKKRLNMMDFDDLLFHWLQLLKEFPEIRQRYAEQFEHILVDEYQDTNPLQAEIIDHLCTFHNNLTVVGDDAQSIYGFRGADCRHILEFPERYPKCQLFYLDKNYRSRPEILTISNRVIAHNEFQFDKELKATRPSGMTPAIAVIKNARQEADFVAQRIKELREDGMSLDEIAVLYRIHSHSLEVQVALQHRAIPFIVRSGVRFFERAHIKDMIAFLRINHNPKDELSWRRILPLFPGIGKATVDKIWKALETHAFDLDIMRGKEVLNTFTKNARRSLQWLLRLLEEAQELNQQPTDILQLFYGQEYKDYVEHTYDDSTQRAEEIEQLILFAEEYETSRQFLDEMTLLNEASPVDQDDEQPPEESVVLTTVHQAKGLEWKAVFILDLAEGSFPFFMSVEEDNLEEERRLFYVASTRAKDQLYLCLRSIYPHKRYGWRNTRPSRFLWEILMPRDVLHERPDNTIKNLIEEANADELLEPWIVDESALLNIDDF